MSVTTESMAAWCRKLLGADPSCPRLTLEQYLANIPRMECLGNLPAGTPVLVRGDVDAKPGAKIGEGDIRLRSMKETLQYGQQRGWKQIVFGHIGREPEKSLSKVAARLGEILGCPVTFLEDWLDPATTTIKPEVVKTIAAAAPGSVLMLQNTRKYDVERVLWKAKPADVDGLAPNLAKLANEFADKVAKVYVHEAFSAGSLDASSVVVPIAMDKVALGKYEAEQFDGHLKECLNAQLVIFSGLKIDKLDDLEAMIARGKIRKVIAAGSLAMALKKASAELEGKQFDLGLSEDPAHKDKPYYIPRERIEQAKRMISEGRTKNIEFIMPVDFVLQDGQVSTSVGPGNQQFDVGPASSAMYDNVVSDFIAAHKSDRPAAVVFHNGVFGMFEDPRFENGTKNFIPQLKRMTDAGIKVYVGGGEGGKALEQYGQPNWITYCFTAGGTVLNALGSEPVPYLVALKMAAEKMGPKPHP
ncbi:MAG: phosphoglycerate kinase [Planctomycetaceae bacterium]|nr:phosphoglycerate kinase [Planctomycetaceae bacterium]